LVVVVVVAAAAAVVVVVPTQRSLKQTVPLFHYRFLECTFTVKCMPDGFEPLATEASKRFTGSTNVPTSFGCSTWSVTLKKKTEFLK
jgi:hypothetical protein